MKVKLKIDEFTDLKTKKTYRKDEEFTIDAKRAKSLENRSIVEIIELEEKKENTK